MSFFLCFSLLGFNHDQNQNIVTEENYKFVTMDITIVTHCLVLYLSTAFQCLYSVPSSSGPHMSIERKARDYLYLLMPPGNEEWCLLGCYAVWLL
jgi:hypothetical protein